MSARSRFFLQTISSELLAENRITTLVKDEDGVPQSRMTFRGSIDVALHAPYKTVLHGRFKGHTLQHVPSTHLKWKIRKHLEMAAFMCAELDRRKQLERLCGEFTEPNNGSI